MSEKPAWEATDDEDFYKCNVCGKLFALHVTRACTIAVHYDFECAKKRPNTETEFTAAIRHTRQQMALNGSGVVPAATPTAQPDQA